MGQGAEVPWRMPSVSRPPALTPPLHRGEVAFRVGCWQPSHGPRDRVPLTRLGSLHPSQSFSPRKIMGGHGAWCVVDSPKLP